MNLRYKQQLEKTPFIKMKPLAAFGSWSLRALPMTGGEMPDVPGVTRVLSAHSSAYLFNINQAGTEVALIDAGMESDAGNIRATLTSRGLDESAVKAIFVTHGHIDHTGGLGMFAEATVYIHEQEKDYVTGEALGEGIMGKLTGRLSEASRVKPERIHTLVGGETILVGSRHVHVYSIAGHTQGSLGFLIEDVLYVGDALYFDTNGEAVLPPVFITQHVTQARRSLTELVEVLADTTIRVVAPSHSGAGSYQSLKRLSQK